MTITYVLRPVPDYGDVFTMSDFVDMVKSTTIVNSDGTGYYSRDGKMMTNEYVDCRDLKTDYDYVVWFNK